LIDETKNVGDAVYRRGFLTLLLLILRRERRELRRHTGSRYPLLWLNKEPQITKEPNHSTTALRTIEPKQAIPLLSSLFWTDKTSIIGVYS